MAGFLKKWKDTLQASPLWGSHTETLNPKPYVEPAMNLQQKGLQGTQLGAFVLPWAPQLRFGVSGLGFGRL